MEYSHTQDYEFALTSADIRRAAEEGVLQEPVATRLINWAFEQNAVRVPKKLLIEQRKGLNLTTVAYYFGALLMIGACAWFLGDKWDALGSPGVFATVLVYIAIALGVGVWLRAKNYLIGGGLLITVAVSLVPLLTYTIEDMSGLWVREHPGAYKNFYPWINASWIVMELATIAAAAIALYFVRFGFLTAPLAFSLWFFSMDVAALISRTEYLGWNERMWVSITVGFFSLLVGYVLDKKLPRNDQARSEDFAFWCYFFGMLAFWGGLTCLEDGSEIGRALYALINIGLIALAVKLRRATFLVFGALGVHIYLGHLAYEVFAQSFFFPFALALLGLSLILVTVYLQRWFNRRQAKLA